MSAAGGAAGEREAIDVERLLEWALRVEAAEAEGIGFGEWGWLMADGSNAATVASYGALGVRIDGGRHKSIGGTRTHSDALEVAHVVSTLPAARLLARHARTGTRPDPMADARPRWGAVLDDRDRPRVSPGWDRNRHPLPRYCPIAWDVSAEEINAARRAYAAWHDGLVLIARHFASAPHRLTRWRPMGPAAPARPADPWLVEMPAPRLVIPDAALPDVAAIRAELHPMHRWARTSIET